MRKAHREHRQRLDFIETPRPAMMLVAWPVCEAAATCCTGPYSVAV